MTMNCKSRAPAPPPGHTTCSSTRFCVAIVIMLIAFSLFATMANAATDCTTGSVETCHNDAADEHIATDGAEDLDALQDRLSQELVDWIRSTEGGYINEKVQLRRSGDNDDGPRGIFTNDVIEADEIICTIPWDIIVKPQQPEDDDEEDDEEDDYGEDDTCSTMQALYDDMKEERTPHGRYLKSMPRNFLPAWWSEAGRELLQKLLGKRLPPQGVRDHHWTKNYAGEAEDCDGDMHDELWSHAVAMVSGRADDDLLVPFYDMINHRNGEYMNTRHSIAEGRFYQLVAHRRIEAGEQLYNSYNQCTVCGGRHDEFGTPEMFFHYGFVESLPHRWFVSQVRLKFDLIESDDPGGEPQVKFMVPPSIWGVTFMEDEVRRLEQFGEDYRDDEGLAATISPFELEMIWQYHNAVLTAFRAAIQAAEDEIDESVWLCDCDWYLVRDWDKEGCNFW